MAATAEAGRRGSPMPKTAIEILKEDHRKAERLFNDISETEDDEECDELWAELANDLRAHVQLEQEVFYPAITKALGEAMPQEVLDDQDEEETEGTEMLEELDGDDLEDEAWMEKFEEFKDIVLKHAKEVEEGTLFPLVEEKMSRKDLEALGSKMEKRHKELHEKLEKESEAR